MDGLFRRARGRAARYPRGMALSVLAAPSSRLRWRMLASAALAGGLLAAIVLPVREARTRRAEVAAVVRVKPPAEQARAVPDDGCRAALETWSAARRIAN